MKLLKLSWRYLLCLPLLACLGIDLASAQIVERYLPGIHYQVVAAADAVNNNENGKQSRKRKPRVAEFFSLGCPHCWHLEPLLHHWLVKQGEGIEFQRIPVQWNKRFKTLAQLYYSLHNMGVAEKYAPEVFQFLHERGKPLWNKAQIDGFVEKELKLPVEDFNHAWDSAAVTQLMTESATVTRAYQISGVPALVINERYLVTIGLAGNFEEMLTIAAFLLNK